MKLQSFLNSRLVGSRPKGSRLDRLSVGHRRHNRRRLFLEGLEERRLMAFDVAVNYAVGSRPEAVVAADFNNDMLDDLAFANYSSHNVSVLLANPDGTFQPALPQATGSSLPPQSLAVGDFNEDGILDLAVGNGWNYGYPANDEVSVLLGISDRNNKGTGNFESPIGTYNLGLRPESMAVGDFNGDGRLDLGVTGNYYGYSSSAQVLLGNGAGGFSEVNTTWLGDGEFASTAVADFNADSIDDFAAVKVSSGMVSVLLGDASGYLQSPSEYSAGASTYTIAAGDVNSDSHIDLVTADTVLLSDGLGGFGAPVQYASGSVGTIIMLRDITGDGHMDIAGTIYGSNQVIVLSGEGNGVFSIPTYATVGSSPWAIAAGDFNGDNMLDIATANYVGGSTSVLLNNGVWPDLNAPRLRIDDITVVEGDSGTVSAVFTVTRSGNLDGSASVFYSTANGGALAGNDYVAVSNTALTFGPGEATKTITILVNGDRTDEYDQGFYVNLSNASDAVITDGHGFGNILDNDEAPTISITSVSKKEGGSNTTSFDFVVTLSAVSEKEVRVNFATANGTATTADNDYIARSGTLIFAPGVTRQTISVLVKGDKKRESDETFFVNLSGALNATIGVAQSLGVILDDDAPGGKKDR